MTDWRRIMLTPRFASRSLLILQWLARLCGLALFLLVLAITIGEGGPPNPLRQPFSVAMQLVLMMIMTLGLIVAWRWEVSGAVATLAALAAFEIVNFAASGRWAGGAFPPFAIPPLLFLGHAALARYRTRGMSVPVT
jgi:hypothetical protein